MPLGHYSTATASRSRPPERWKLWRHWPYRSLVSWGRLRKESWPAIGRLFNWMRAAKCCSGHPIAASNGFGRTPHSPLEMSVSYAIRSLIHAMPSDLDPRRAPLAHRHTHRHTHTHVFPRLEKWFSILLFRRVMAVVSVVVGAPQLSSVVNVDFQKGVRRAPTARQSDVRPNGGGPSKWIKVASSPTKGWNDASEQKSHGHFAMSALKAATRSRGCDCETLSGRRKGNNKPDPSSSVSMND